MLENFTDEQIKTIFVIAVCVAPMIVSAIAYGVIEKIRSKPVIVKKD